MPFSMEYSIPLTEASAQLIDVSDYDDTKKDDLLDWLRNNI